MQSSIMYGIVQPLLSVSQQLNFTCPTGDCNYEEFESLSVCSVCENLSSRLFNVKAGGGARLNISLDSSNPAVEVTERPVLQYRLPNGLYLDNSVSLTMLGTTNQSRSITYQDIDTLVWSQSVIRHRTDPSLLQTNDTSPSVEATECSLFYCVKTYTSKVRNGTLFEEATINKTAFRSPESWDIIQDPDRTPLNLTASRRASLAFHPRFSYLKRNDLEIGSGYNISQSAVNSISSFTQTTFSFCLPPTNCNGSIEPVSDNWTPINGFYMGKNDSAQYAPSVAQAMWESASISDTFASIAASMSNAIRMGGGRDAAKVRAEVGITLTLYAVDWRWIALHCFVELFGIVFVIITLVMSWGYIPLWGSNTLAVLARGEAVSDVFRGAETVNEMQARARGVSVVLLDGRMREVEIEMEVDDLLMQQENSNAGQTQYGVPRGGLG